MKTKFLNLAPIFLLTALFVGLASCSNDSLENEDLKAYKATLYEVIEAQKTDVSKSDKNNAPGDDSIAIIAINGGFDELVNALTHVDTELNAGLVDLFLNGTDQYTVFAPTDDAFMALYSALGVSSIFEVDPELVLNVLVYHVTNGRRAAKSVVPKKNLKNIQTLLGVPFQVNSDAQIIAVGNTSNIIATDITASNGIIHVIDQVLLPIN
ncbi:MAG: fasciclin domain-containing protein [Bacteroidia bacterium]|nr:fasciclin domain-containing protein [Bacteroidia bacterium]NND26132.1 fasciclin domain-containing protein [Flavobacteriaceae bacterium]NNK60073.1 fasciclin domain-containing protein [Flavobacteriaceae bacterium]